MSKQVILLLQTGIPAVVAALVLSLFLLMSAPGVCGDFETDSIGTSAGDLRITFIGHASLMLEFDGKVIHVDPWGRMADYTALPKADLVLVTHNHIDHLDPKALDEIRTAGTEIVYAESCREAYPGGTVVHYGDTLTVKGLYIETVPAYNLINMKNPGGRLVHPKGLCNGYIVTFGDLRVYFAGETENIPELCDIGDIDILFLAVDSVYNLTPRMAADVAKLIAPDVLYPIHFADAEVTGLIGLLEDTGTEVRLRKMK